MEGILSWAKGFFMRIFKNFLLKKGGLKGKGADIMK